jgi:hypothetical protein
MSPPINRPPGEHEGVSPLRQWSWLHRIEAEFNELRRQSDLAYFGRELAWPSVEMSEEQRREIRRLLDEEDA